MCYLNITQKYSKNFPIKNAHRKNIFRIHFNFTSMNVPFMEFSFYAAEGKYPSLLNLTKNSLSQGHFNLDEKVG